MTNIKPKTILCDIDGVLLKHKGDICSQHIIYGELLSGVKEKFQEWDKKGYKIILITGRRESTRKSTEIQLSRAGIFYDQLIMGVGNGVRVLINDTKPDSDIETAEAYTVKRNAGIKDLDI